VSDRLLSEVKKRLLQDDVIVVVVSPSGRIVDVKADQPLPRIPRGGRLFSLLLGSGKVVEADLSL